MTSTVIIFVVIIIVVTIIRTDVRLFSEPSDLNVLLHLVRMQVEGRTHLVLRTCARRIRSIRVPDLLVPVLHNPH